MKQILAGIAKVNALTVELGNYYMAQAVDRGDSNITLPKLLLNSPSRLRQSN